MGEGRGEEREQRGAVWSNALLFIDFFDCFQSECCQELHCKADKAELLLLKCAWGSLGGIGVSWDWDSWNHQEVSCSH